MQIKITRIDKTLELPKHETSGSVGFDFLTREDATIDPGEIQLIPANVIIEVPPGYMLMVALRSSTPRKFGLMIPQGVGIVDQDYCGPDDEIKLQVFNFRDEPIHVPRGSRIAQGVLIRVESVGHFWEQERETLGESRGGFGSTG